MVLSKFNFRNKLLILFFFSSVFPLILISFFVHQNVQSTYHATLENSFRKNAQIRQQILLYFLESELSWVRSIAAQNIFLEAIENQIASQDQNLEITEDPSSSQKMVFANLTSIRKENPFIERAYIIDATGEVLVSTATNDVGSKLGPIPFTAIPLEEKKPYVGKIIISPYQKRVIPLSAPLIRKSDNMPIGVLVIDLNSNIIRALFEGKLYTQHYLNQQVQDSEYGETYVIDDDGYPLTELKHQPAENKINTKPVNDCIGKGQGANGIWKSYYQTEVLGLSSCFKFDGLTWTLVIEEPVSSAFAPSRQLTMTLIIITLGLGFLLFFLTLILSRSIINNPITELSRGAHILGSGNLDYRINLQTGDELEELANAFNIMADKLKNLVSDLKKEKEILENQKTQLDQSTQMLMRRDLELQETNKEMEQKKILAEAEKNKFKVVLRGVSDGVIAVNLDRVIIAANKATGKITGCTQQEIIGQKIERVLKLFERGREIKTEEYCPITTSDFEGVIYAKSAVKTVSAKNKVSFVNIVVGKIKETLSIGLGAIITLHDITNEIELEKMKLDFVSMAAHELRAPLTTIKGYLSFINQKGTLDKLDKKEQEFISRAVISSDNLSKLIENLMIVSRIEEGKIIMEVKPTQITDLIKRKITELEPWAKSKGLRLIFRNPNKTPPLITADPLRIEEVLTNLIGNAINYTQKGRITISVDLKEGNIVTSIADTGQGIPEEALPRLFTKFFRVMGTLEAGSKGTGLGLYISKNIVEALGGKIWVESKLNEGSTFYFSLPIA